MACDVAQGVRVGPDPKGFGEAEADPGRRISSDRPTARDLAGRAPDGSIGGQRRATPRRTATMSRTTGPDAVARTRRPYVLPTGDITTRVSPRSSRSYQVNFIITEVIARITMEAQNVPQRRMIKQVGATIS